MALTTTHLNVLLLALCCFGAAEAGFDNFPVKSYNLNHGEHPAYVPEIYTSEVTEGFGFFDAHPVHGFLLSDGGIAYTGKFFEAEEGTDPNYDSAFVFRLDAKGKIVWTHASNIVNAHDAANAVLQLPSVSGVPGDLIYVGYTSVGGKWDGKKDVGGVYKRSITKLKFDTGEMLWRVTWDSDTPTKAAAWEFAELTKDGSAVLLAGNYDNCCGQPGEWLFKSYGCVSGGLPIVQSLPVSALLGATGPAASAVTWTKKFKKEDKHITAKKAAALDNGDSIVIIISKLGSQIMRLDSSGKSVWGPKNAAALGQLTDVVQSFDGTRFAVMHQNKRMKKPGPGLSGGITTFDLDGNPDWQTWVRSTPYDGSAGPSARNILNECWGMAAMEDGYVAGCGTGIENCPAGEEMMTGQFLSDCLAGTADKRPGAIPRHAAIWQSFVWKTSLYGTLEWSRADQWRKDGDPAIGQKEWEVHSSACEYVAVDAKGTIWAVQDEQSGYGLLKLVPPTSTPAAAPVAVTSVQLESQTMMHMAAPAAIVGVLAVLALVVVSASAKTQQTEFASEIQSGSHGAKQYESFESPSRADPTLL